MDLVLDNLTELIVAVIVAAPAFLAWRNSTKTHKEVTTSGGDTLGERVERIEGQVEELKSEMDAALPLFTRMMRKG